MYKGLEKQNEDLYETWRKDVENDPEVGGEKLKESSEFAHRALKHFAPPELLEFFKNSPFGNNPNVVKTFAKIGRAMASDKLIQAGEGAFAPKSHADVLYGSSDKTES